MDLINWLISNVATLLAALGLFLTVWTLRANHDWNRRNYAANLSAKWSEETGDHRKAIEKIRPGLIDLDRQSKKIEEITQDDARKIYLSTPDNSDLWELKFHFIALLNYFEVVASAYKYSIGDEKMIEEEFRDVLVNWYHILNYFIKEVAEKRGYQPWRPYVEVASTWAAHDYRRREPPDSWENLPFFSWMRGSHRRLR